MKQISAAQASLGRANRLVLKNHLETYFSDAVREERGQAAMAGLVVGVEFSPALTRPKASVRGEATDKRGCRRPRVGGR
ncbi:MAG: metal-sensing transcriptional repressor [Actinomycetota bacterium]